MKALKVTLLEPVNIEPVRALSRGLGRFIFAASVLIILFAGTFPFDFTFTSRHATAFDWRLIQYDPYFSDRGQNILFFLPFGFGFASIIRTRMDRARWRLATAPVASLALSALVEVGQKYVSFRDPTLMDLWANTLGGTIGAGIYVLFGDRMLAAMARGLLQLQRFATPSLAGSAVAIYGLIHLLAPLILRDPGDLSVWDPNLPLVVGNEVSGDRPWRGTVSEVIVADRAINDAEVHSLATGTAPKEIFADSLLGHYRLAGSSPYPDIMGQLPALTWAGPAPATMTSDAPPVDATHWLTTGSAVELANRRIMKSSQFTFAAVVTTTDLDQRGPARLASISEGISSRNIQLAQEFAYLVVRVRNALRSAPELYVHDVFTPGKPRHIVVTTRAAETIVYLDGKEEGRMKITPEAKIIWRLYPRGFRIRLEEYGFRAYAAIYRALIFIPFAALLGATLLLVRWPIAARTLLAIGSLITLAVLLEVMLGRLGGQFEPINFVISLLIGFGTLGGLILWRRVKDVHD